MGLEGFGSLSVIPGVPTTRSCPEPRPADIPCELEGVDGGVCLTAASMGCKHPRGSCKGKEKRGLISAGGTCELRAKRLLPAGSVCHSQEGKKNRLCTQCL